MIVRVCLKYLVSVFKKKFADSWSKASSVSKSFEEKIFKNLKVLGLTP